MWLAHLQKILLKILSKTFYLSSLAFYNYYSTLRKKSQDSKWWAEGCSNSYLRIFSPPLYHLSYLPIDWEEKCFRYTNYIWLLESNQSSPLGAPSRTRTCDLPLRRRLFFPTELLAHKKVRLRAFHSFAGLVVIRVTHNSILQASIILMYRA